MLINLLIFIHWQNKSSPGITVSNPNNRGASDANEGGDVLNNNAKPGQNLGDGRTISLLNALTALQRTSAASALTSGLVPTCRSGDRKSGESESNKRELELHIEFARRTGTMFK